MLMGGAQRQDRRTAYPHLAVGALSALESPTRRTIQFASIPMEAQIPTRPRQSQCLRGPGTDAESYARPGRHLQWRFQAGFGAVRPDARGNFI